MKNLKFLIFITIFGAIIIRGQLHAQNVGIGSTSFTPDPSAALEIRSNNKGILISRMTESQRTSISNPSTGLLVYQIDNNAGFYYWNGNQWIFLNPNVNYGMPQGSIIMYSGPWYFDNNGLGIGNLNGWALCNGQNGTPNLSDRFVIATNNQSSLLSSGGNNFYNLTQNQLPAHNHYIPNDGAHNHGATMTIGMSCEYLDSAEPPCSWDGIIISATSTAGDHNHTGATGMTGNGDQIDNRPAYIALAFIMKL
ncbi:MAG TPA: hypothetical protein PKI46_00805 [Bacteroidales bacterium]|nr:hypothetical protein [Bacteroidales bacterium]